MFYGVFGLVFQSDLPLWGQPLQPQPADVVVSAGPVAVADGESWCDQGVCYRARPQDCLLEVAEVGRIRITSGRELRVELERPEAKPDMLVLLQSSALGALFYQRGQLALHASVVEKDGQAILFCGRSSAGKSALAAALSNHGYRPLSDELAVIQECDGRICVSPGPPHLKLWTDTLAKLELDFGQTTQVRSSVLHKHLVPMRPVADRPVPVGEIVILDWWNKPEFHWEEVQTPANFQALLRHTYRGAYAQGLGPNPAYFQSAVRLARQARVQVVIRPDSGPERLLDFANFVEEKLG